MLALLLFAIPVKSATNRYTISVTGTKKDSQGYWTKDGVRVQVCRCPGPCFDMQELPNNLPIECTLETSPGPAVKPSMVIIRNKAN